MNNVELAYLAGVMDSDGSFSIAIDTWRQRKYERTPAYQELVAISQADPEALELAKELFGGALWTEKARGERRRPLTRWQVTNRRAIAVARALLPYLRIKRPQAELLISLRAIKDRGRKANSELVRPHVRVLLPAVVAEMDALARQIRDLNDTRHPLALG